MGKEFDRSFRMMLASQKPDITIILEPRCSGSKALNIIRKWGFRFHIISDARGYSEGVWVLWNSEDIQITALDVQNQYVHVEIVERNVEPWLITAVYASPKECERH